MNRKYLMTAAAAMTAMSAMMAVTAGAEEADYVYGTMQIPYAQFYEAEGVSSEVDSVSSATTTKWNGSDLVAGSYSVPHADDEGGEILGVVYPVAITAEDLEAMGDDTYGFEESSEVPAAYKIVTVEDGTPSFSAVQGETTSFESDVELVSNGPWGDYEIDVAALDSESGTVDLGTIYGVLVKTSDGSVYGMRHLENIWRNEISWSCGFYVTEPHGNVMSYEAYADMNGKTVSEIDYITADGYATLAVDVYLPIKFDGGVEVESVPTSAGTAAVTVTGMPEDFEAAYTVEGLECEASAEAVTFTEALPGSYTLTVTDESGVYDTLYADFILSTDELPVTFDAESGCIVAAEGADETLAATFIANIESVTVGEDTYNATGRRGVTIVMTDGYVDPEAAVTSGRGEEATETPIFGEAGTYAITVVSTGFDNPLTFDLVIE